MSRIRRHLNILAAIGLISLTGWFRTAAASWPRETTPQEPSRREFVDSAFAVQITSDLPYGASIGGAPNSFLLDVYEPVGAAAPAVRPAFLAIHGGGFTGGDKAQGNISELCRELASRGYVCTSINYRLTTLGPDGSLLPNPSQAVNDAVADAARALEWLVGQASRWRIDPRRLAIGGSSAGATIALRLGYDPQSPRPPVGAVLGWSGALYAPMERVSLGEPALFVIHGTADNLVPVRAGLTLVARAKAIALPHAVLICKGLGHVVPLDRRPFGKPIYAHVASFLAWSLDLAHLGQTALPVPQADRGVGLTMPVDTLAVDCPR